MQKIEVQITEEYKKKRLDKALADLLEEYKFSRTRIQNLIKEGVVFNKNINPPAAITNPSYKVLGDELLEVDIPKAVEAGIKPAPHIHIEVVYEDDDLLVINKQAGLTVHPGAGNYDDTLVNALVAKLGDNLSGINGELRPGIVHRLDRETSGLMLVAKNDQAHNFLSEAIQHREVKRVYHAVVWNSPRLPEGKVSEKIGRHPKDRKKMAVVKNSGKYAQTHYKLLGKYHDGRLSLLECRLQTGRTHQIRVHMEHLKMPLVGDQTYYGQPTYKKTGGLSDELNESLKAFPRQALHSKYIEFEHPSTGDILSFESEYPKDISELIEELK